MVVIRSLALWKFCCKLVFRVRFLSVASECSVVRLQELPASGFHLSQPVCMAPLPLPLASQNKMGKDTGPEGNHRNTITNGHPLVHRLQPGKIDWSSRNPHETWTELPLPCDKTLRHKQSCQVTLTYLYLPALNITFELRQGEPHTLKAEIRGTTMEVSWVTVPVSVFSMWRCDFGQKKMRVIILLRMALCYEVTCACQNVRVLTCHCCHSGNSFLTS